MKKIILLFCFLLYAFSLVKAQTPFPEKCLGNWKGMMYIYSQGVLRDSVPVKMTIAKTSDPNTWTWKTEYLSAKMPQTKDYLLRLKDKEKNSYVTDEGGGVELNNYVFGNKMYDVFEVQGITLTSTYEIVGKNLVFEVTSGKKLETSAQGITNFSVNNLQRVVLEKME
jgi:hypothetical protein